LYLFKFPGSSAQTFFFKYWLKRVAVLYRLLEQVVCLDVVKEDPRAIAAVEAAKVHSIPCLDIIFKTFI